MFQTLLQALFNCLPDKPLRWQDDTVNACATGGCPQGDGGKFTCRATGRPPASLAEFNIDADGTDWVRRPLRAAS